MNAEKIVMAHNQSHESWEITYDEDWTVNFILQIYDQDWHITIVEGNSNFEDVGLPQWAIESIIDKWISETDKGRLFFKKGAGFNEIMVRHNARQTDPSIKKSITLARITVEKDTRRKGLFCRLITAMENIANNHKIELIVECAAPVLSSILMYRGYLMDKNARIGIYGSWVYNPKSTKPHFLCLALNGYSDAEIQNINISAIHISSDKVQALLQSAVDVNKQAIANALK